MANKKHVGNVGMFSWTPIEGQLTKGRNGEIMVSDDEQNMSGAAEIPCYSVDRVVPLRPTSMGVS
jgi:hypothetical protein